MQNGRPLARRADEVEKQVFLDILRRWAAVRWWCIKEKRGLCEKCEKWGAQLEISLRPGPFLVE